MSFEFILMFTTTVFFVSIIPGPSMLLALSHGISFGVRRSLISATGNAIVTLCQSIISIIGVGAILAASSDFYYILKILGGFYLFYMGVTLVINRDNKVNSVDKQNLESKDIFIQSAIITASNPKALVFFTAILPQFIDTDGSYLKQSVILTMICFLVAFTCFMLYAAGGERLAYIFSNSNHKKYMSTVIGLLFMISSIFLVIN